MEAIMETLIWLASGALSGWVAGKLMKGRDYGVSGNIILGILGSVVGGWVLDVLGFAGPRDLWRHALVSLMGSMLTLGIARRLRPVARGTRRVSGDRGAIDRLLKRGEHRDPNTAFEEGMTFGERVADKVARFGGSWTFIGSFLLLMLLWMILNGQLKKPFDPFPFILLNLCLSCLAALQAPVIMMSQNRQASKDRLMASNDYEVNLRSELGIHSLHTRFDELRERDWAELVKMQQRQIELLESIVRDLSEKDGGTR